MPIWLQAAFIGLVLLFAWTFAERSVLDWRRNRLRAKGFTFTIPAFKVWAPRLVLLLVLMATVHASIDPDHDRHSFRIHLGELQHAVYAFVLTLALLLSFPTLRTAAAGGWVIAAGLTVELLQAISILPGRPHPTDILADIAGVAAAVVPITIGAVRAKRRAEVLAREEAPRRRSRRSRVEMDDHRPDPQP